MPWGTLRDMVLGQAKGLVNTGLSPVAIDFGTGSLKILQVHRGETGSSLVAAAALPTPEELLNDPAKRLAFQAEGLARLIKTGGFKGKRAVCAIPGSLSFTKHMKVPKTDGAPIKAIVEAALVQQYGCLPSQMVFRHVEIADIPNPSGGVQTEVVCIAATRELVERLMQALNKAGLQPVGMHAEQLALLRAFEPLSRRADDKKSTTLMLDIGAGATTLLIAHGTTLVFSKRIDMGGKFLDEAICRQTHCTIEEARAQRREMDATILASSGPTQAQPTLTREGTLTMSGSLEATVTRGERIDARANSSGAGADRRGVATDVFSPELSTQPLRAFSPPKADLREPLEILTDDIGLSLRYYSSLFPTKPVERAVFVGGEAVHRGLCQHIARAIRLPAQVADPLAAVARTGKETTPGVDLKQPQPGWAVVLGLCLAPTDL